MRQGLGALVVPWVLLFHQGAAAQLVVEPVRCEWQSSGHAVNGHHANVEWFADYQDDPGGLTYYARFLVNRNEQAVPVYWEPVDLRLDSLASGHVAWMCFNHHGPAEPINGPIYKGSSAGASSAWRPEGVTEGGEPSQAPLVASLAVGAEASEQPSLAMRVRSRWTPSELGYTVEYSLEAEARTIVVSSPVLPTSGVAPGRVSVTPGFRTVWVTEGQILGTAAVPFTLMADDGVVLAVVRMPIFSVGDPSSEEGRVISSR